MKEKTIIQKLYSILVALLIVLGSVPLNVHSEEISSEFNYENPNFDLVNENNVKSIDFTKFKDTQDITKALKYTSKMSGEQLETIFSSENLKKQLSSENFKQITKEQLLYAKDPDSLLIYAIDDISKLDKNALDSTLKEKIGITSGITFSEGISNVKLTNSFALEHTSPSGKVYSLDLASLQNVKSISVTGIDTGAYPGYSIVLEGTEEKLDVKASKDFDLSFDKEKGEYVIKDKSGGESILKIKGKEGEILLDGNRIILSKGTEIIPDGSHGLSFRSEVDGLTIDITKDSNKHSFEVNGATKFSGNFHGKELTGKNFDGTLKLTLPKNQGSNEIFDISATKGDVVFGDEKYTGSFSASYNNGAFSEAVTYTKGSRIVSSLGTLVNTDGEPTMLTTKKASDELTKAIKAQEEAYVKLESMSESDPNRAKLMKEIRTTIKDNLKKAVQNEKTESKIKNIVFADANDATIIGKLSYSSTLGDTTNNFIKNINTVSESAVIKSYSTTEGKQFFINSFEQAPGKIADLNTEISVNGKKETVKTSISKPDGFTKVSIAKESLTKIKEGLGKDNAKIISPNLVINNQINLNKEAYIIGVKDEVISDVDGRALQLKVNEFKKEIAKAKIILDTVVKPKEYIELITEQAKIVQEIKQFDSDYSAHVKSQGEEISSLLEQYKLTGNEETRLKALAIYEASQKEKEQYIQTREDMIKNVNLQNKEYGDIVELGKQTSEITENSLKEYKDLKAKIEEGLKEYTFSEKASITEVADALYTKDIEKLRAIESKLTDSKLKDLSNKMIANKRISEGNFEDALAAINKIKDQTTDIKELKKITESVVKKDFNSAIKLASSATALSSQTTYGLVTQGILTEGDRIRNTKPENLEEFYSKIEVKDKDLKKFLEPEIEKQKILNTLSMLDPNNANDASKVNGILAEIRKSKLFTEAEKKEIVNGALDYTFSHTNQIQSARISMYNLATDLDRKGLIESFLNSPETQNQVNIDINGELIPVEKLKSELDEIKSRIDESNGKLESVDTATLKTVIAKDMERSKLIEPDNFDKLKSKIFETKDISKTYQYLTNDEAIELFNKKKQEYVGFVTDTDRLNRERASGDTLGDNVKRDEKINENNALASQVTTQMLKLSNQLTSEQIEAQKQDFSYLREKYKSDFDSVVDVPEKRDLYRYLTKKQFEDFSEIEKNLNLRQNEVLISELAKSEDITRTKEIKEKIITNALRNQDIDTETSDMNFNYERTKEVTLTDRLKSAGKSISEGFSTNSKIRGTLNGIVTTTDTTISVGLDSSGNGVRSVLNAVTLGYVDTSSQKMEKEAKSDIAEQESKALILKKEREVIAKQILANSGDDFNRLISDVAAIELGKADTATLNRYGISTKAYDMIKNKDHGLTESFSSLAKTKSERESATILSAIVKDKFETQSLKPEVKERTIFDYMPHKIMGTISEAIQTGYDAGTINDYIGTRTEKNNAAWEKYTKSGVDGIIKETPNSAMILSAVGSITSERLNERNLERKKLFEDTTDPLERSKILIETTEDNTLTQRKIKDITGDMYVERAKGSVIKKDFDSAIEDMRIASATDSKYKNQYENLKESVVVYNTNTNLKNFVVNQATSAIISAGVSSVGRGLKIGYSKITKTPSPKLPQIPGFTRWATDNFLNPLGIFREGEFTEEIIQNAAQDFATSALIQSGIDKNLAQDLGDIVGSYIEMGPDNFAKSEKSEFDAARDKYDSASRTLRTKQTELTTALKKNYGSSIVVDNGKVFSKGAEIEISKEDQKTADMLKSISKEKNSLHAKTVSVVNAKYDRDLADIHQEKALELKPIKDELDREEQVRLELTAKGTSEEINKQREKVEGLKTQINKVTQKYDAQAMYIESNRNKELAGVTLERQKDAFVTEDESRKAETDTAYYKYKTLETALIRDKTLGRNTQKQEAEVLETKTEYLNKKIEDNVAIKKLESYITALDTMQNQDTADLTVALNRMKMSAERDKIALEIERTTTIKQSRALAGISTKETDNKITELEIQKNQKEKEIVESVIKDKRSTEDEITEAKAELVTLEKIGAIITEKARLGALESPSETEKSKLEEINGILGKITEATEIDTKISALTQEKTIIEPNDEYNEAKTQIESDISDLNNEQAELNKEVMTALDKMAVIDEKEVFDKLVSLDKERQAKMTKVEEIVTDKGTYSVSYTVNVENGLTVNSVSLVEVKEDGTKETTVVNDKTTLDTVSEKLANALSVEKINKQQVTVEKKVPANIIPFTIQDEERIVQEIAEEMKICA